MAGSVPEIGMAPAISGSKSNVAAQVGAALGVFKSNVRDAGDLEDGP